MADHSFLENLFNTHGMSDFKWIDPNRIVVREWVRMKCIYGCDEYGIGASCPPHVPPVDECRLFFKEYTEAVVFHFQKLIPRPEDRFVWTRQVNQGLLTLEREVFLSGYYKAFLLFMDSCNFCTPCSGSRSVCKKKKEARPTPEALGIDVFETVRGIGYPIQVLPDTAQAMNRYAFLLVS